MSSDVDISTVPATEPDPNSLPRDSVEKNVSRRHPGSQRHKNGWVYVLLILATVIIFGPFLLALLASLRTNDDYITSSSIWPSAWTLHNYRSVFTDVPMGRMIFNGLFIAILATAGNLLASLVAAFSLAKLRFPGRSQLFGVTLFTMLIPGAVTLIPLYTIIRAVGLVDSPWALILPFWTGSAFAVFFLRQHLLGIPHEMFEAAVLDGCSIPGTIFRIYLPLIRGPLSILAILNFLASWNDLLGPLVYLNSPEKMTPTVGLTYFQGQYTTNFPVVLAGALVILVPTTIVFLIFNRQLRHGMLIGGLK
jgi:multiple sugar transport system permease protein